MSGWSSGYVADIGYTFGYYRELAPVMFPFLSMLKGQHGPKGRLSYCELGCGQGFSMNILAAANPQIDFHATDFNPSQIAGAQGMANAAGIPNVHFYDQSFAVFAHEMALPEKFDIISLHGIFSWISAENRAHIVDFIDRKLKPGGQVYISYNCLPGWAGPSPMRKLMRMAGDATPGGTVQKVDAGIRLVEKVMGANARYFQSQPALKDRVEKLKNHQKNYLAHEYLNSDWNLFYHSDVADELSAARLSFLGSAFPLDHVDAVNLTNDQQAVLNEAPDGASRETLRDFMINQQFRRDVFARGTVPITLGEAQDLWLDSRFILSTVRALVPKTVNGGLGEANLQPEVYDPILDAFAGALEKSGAVTLRQLFADYPAVAALGWQRVQQAIVVLVGANHLQPCLPDAASDSKRKQSTRRLNDVIMQRSRHSADLQFLTSPVTGAGVGVDRFQQLFLLARQTNAADAVSFVWRTLDAIGQRIVKEGVPLDTEEKNRAELAERYAAFEQRLPILRAMGI